jgi:hypothetical protein
MHDMTKMCPYCVVEYRWNFTQCADCGAALVTAQGFDPKAKPRPRNPEGAAEDESIFRKLRLKSGGDDYVEDEKLLLSPDEMGLVGLRTGDLDDLKALGRWLADAGIPHRVDLVSHENRSAFGIYGSPSSVIIYGLLVREADIPQALIVDQQHQDAEFPEAVSELEGGSPEAPRCPACGAIITPDVQECPDCGIPFMQEE